MATQVHLVVLIRGWTNENDLLAPAGKSGEYPEEFRRFVEESIPGAVVAVPRLDLSMFSIATPEAVAGTLYNQVEKLVAHYDPGRITIVGYSAGSIFARWLFCRARGADASAQVDPDRAAPWADRIERIVMLAAITRGWSISTATPVLQRFLSPALTALTGLICRFKGGMALIAQLRRNEPFVITSRLQQIAVEEHAKAHGGLQKLPLIVSVLGTHDEYISPVDCMDLVSHERVFFLEVPGTNHTEILDVTGDAERENRVRQAISGDEEALRALAIRPDDINDYIDELDRMFDASQRRGDEPVSDAVIVVHGIRDEGFWTKRVAKEIKQLGRPAVVRAPSPSYGFFSMWDFIRRHGRYEQTLWFLEQYVEVANHYRGAQISFVGHSNGTYLVKKALEVCPAVRFRNLVLVGSVIRCDFAWSRVASQIAEHVYNIRAAGDHVVSMLPGALERAGLRYFDVGGAGFRGFEEAATTTLVKEFGPITGGHGAAVGEPYWPRLAALALGKGTPEFPQVAVPALTRLLSGVAPLLLFALLLVLAYVVYTLFTGLSFWAAVLSLVALFAAVRYFVRFF